MTGCELYRVISPYHHLKEQGFNVGWCSIKQIPNINLDHWDVIVMPRLALVEPEHTNELIDQLHKQGKVLVYEVDDDFFNLPSSNPSYNPQMLEQMKGLMIGADLITVSTPQLGRVMRQCNDWITVLPNCIDPCIWKPDYQRVVEGLTIGAQGGHSHYEDWKVLKEVIPPLAKEFPKVKFVFAGYVPDYLEALDLGDRLVKLPWVPIDRYPTLVAQIDIAFCPLEDTLFNRSKSFIKAMETGVQGRPVIASPTVYSGLISHRTTGFLAREPDQWVHYARKLINKPQLRRQLGQNLRGKIMADYNIHKEAWRWMEAYRLVWERVIETRGLRNRRLTRA